MAEEEIEWGGEGEEQEGEEDTVEEKQRKEQEKKKKKEEEEEEEDPRKLLVKEQVDMYRELYNYLDIEGKGKLPNKHLGTALRMLGLNPREFELLELIERFDKEFKGYMDFKTFLLPVCWTMDWLPDTMEDVIAAFKVMDKKGEGEISNSDLLATLTSLGEVLEDFEIDSLIKMGDKGKEGLVRYEEFVTKLMVPPKKGKDKKKK